MVVLLSCSFIIALINYVSQRALDVKGYRISLKTEFMAILA